MSERLSLSGCWVDLASGRVSWGDREEQLSPAELRLLQWLAAHPGEDVSRERLLQEVWGYAAAVVSRTVDTTVRRLRQKLEADPRQPAHVHTVRGVGYRFEPLLSAPSRPAPASDAAAVAVTIRLPAPLTPFVGRAEALARMDALLAQRRVVSICGPGGVGKTRLAIAAARRQQALFSDILFCGLASARDEEGVLAAFSEAVGVPGLGTPEALTRALRERQRVLLVCDNAEHVLEVLGPLLARLVGALASLVVLVTTRQRLRLRGEAILALPPMSPADALLLLAERYADAVGAPPEDALAPALAELADRLDRLPLAIELAAAQLDLFSPADVLAQLSDRFAVLSSDWVGVDPRQATMWAAVDWSWSRLAPPEQAALARCALVRGQISAGSFAALVDAAPMPPGAPAAPVLLAALRRKSLLQADGAGVRMLESVRDFAAAQMPAERDAAALGWSRWLIAQAAEVRKRLYRDTTHSAVDWLRAAREDLLAVWDRHQDDDPRIAGLALIIIHPLLGTEGLLAASEARYLDAVTLPLSAGVRVQLHIALAELHGWRNSRDAITHAEAAFALSAGASAELQLLAALARVRFQPDSSAVFEGCEALLEQARVERGLPLLEALLLHAEMVRRAGDGSHAIALLEEALEVCAAEGWPLHEVSACRALGLLRSRSGDAAGGIALLERAIALAAQQGDVFKEGWIRNALGIVYLERSQHQRASACFRDALRILQRIGEGGVASVQTNLAAIHHQERRLDQARQLYTSALPEMLAGGRHFEIALTRTNLADVELEAGRLDACDAHLRVAEEVATELGASWVLSFAAAVRAGYCVLRGQLSAGLAACSAGVQHAQAACDLRMEAFVWVQKGTLLAAQGELAAAEAALDRAVELITTQGDATILGMAHIRRACVRRLRGDADGAAADVGKAVISGYVDGAVAVYRGLGRPETAEGRTVALLLRG